MTTRPPLPKLYRELATWWPLLSDPAEYAEEASLYFEHLAATCDGAIESLLELGCGGGNNASHLKHKVDRLCLTDLSAEMIAVSRALNPECDHSVGDMRGLRLGRTFDAVFVHDAICYMLSEDDLRQAIETAWSHCRPGGAALFAPDFVRENFRPGEDCGGRDEPDLGEEDGVPRGLRYLEWVWDPDPGDTRIVVDYAYLLRERDGSVISEHDRHIEGLFPREAWLRLLSGVGFESIRAVPFEHSEVEAGRHEFFVARRPHAGSESRHAEDTGC